MINSTTVSLHMIKVIIIWFNTINWDMLDAILGLKTMLSTVKVASQCVNNTTYITSSIILILLHFLFLANGKRVKTVVLVAILHSILDF